jgi:hypothetical protein
MESLGGGGGDKKNRLYEGGYFANNGIKLWFGNKSLISLVSAAEILLISQKH